MRGWTHLSSTSHAAEIACLDFASCETTRTDRPACRRQGYCWLSNRGWPDLRPHFFGSDRQNFGSATRTLTRSAEQLRLPSRCRDVKLGRVATSAVLPAIWNLVLVRRRPGGTRPFPRRTRGCARPQCTISSEMMGSNSFDLPRRRDTSRTALVRCEDKGRAVPTAPLGYGFVNSVERPAVPHL